MTSASITSPQPYTILVKKDGTYSLILTEETTSAAEPDTIRVRGTLNDKTPSTLTSFFNLVTSNLSLIMLKCVLLTLNQFQTSLLLNKFALPVVYSLTSRPITYRNASRKQRTQELNWIKFFGGLDLSSPCISSYLKLVEHVINPVNEPSFPQPTNEKHQESEKIVDKKETVSTTKNSPTTEKTTQVTPLLLIPVSGATNKSFQVPYPAPPRPPPSQTPAPKEDPILTQNRSVDFNCPHELPSVEELLKDICPYNLSLNSSPQDIAMMTSLYDLDFPELTPLQKD